MGFKGPFGRAWGVVGLVLLLPIAFSMAIGSLAPVDAAPRAVLALFVAVLGHRATQFGLRRSALWLARQAAAEQDEAAKAAGGVTA